MDKMVILILLAIFEIDRHRFQSEAVSIPNNPFAKKIPIGSIFDDESWASQAAFRYEVDKHNNLSLTTNSFRLEKSDKRANISDNFQFCKAICSVMSDGIFALFGSTQKISFQSTTDSYSRVFHMPYISPTAPPSGWGFNNSAFTLFLRPVYLQAMLEIIRYFGWTRIYYVYDSNEGLSRVEYMHGAVNKEDTQLYIDALRIKNVERCHVMLRQLDNRQQSGDKFIILDMANDQALQTVLKQIQNVGMNRVNYHYLIGSLSVDELDLEDFKHGGANITGFRLVDPSSDRVKDNLKDWMKMIAPLASNSTALKILRSRDRDRAIPLEAALTIDGVRVMIKGLADLLTRVPTIFQYTFRRGQVYNNGDRGITCNRKSSATSTAMTGSAQTSHPATWNHGATIINSFKQIKFEGLTGAVAFDERGHRKHYKLDIMHLKMDKELELIGRWEFAKGLTITLKPNLGLGGKTEPKNTTKIITTIKASPYLMVKDDGNKYEGNDRYEGYAVDLAEKIAELVGFQYRLKLVSDDKYGERLPDGNWNGMIGELTRKEADLAIAPLTITSIRERVIDFSKPFMSLGISIMIKKPEKQKPGVFSFMEPLSQSIWLCIVISYLGVSLVLFLVSRFSPNEWQIEEVGRHGRLTFTNDFTLLNSLWFSLGAFMRRGCDVCPRSLSGRIVGSAWWFFTLIIISSYTANLAAFLTIERMLTPINGADDLAKQREILYGTVDAGSTKEFFKVSKIATYEKMWNFMTTEGNVFAQTTEAGVDRVRKSKGKYAFLMESTMNDYYNQRKPCNTMKVGGNLDSKGYGIGTFIGSDLRDKINVAVLQLLEQEKLQKLQKKWWYDKGECVIETDTKSGTTQSSLSLSNVAGIFYILIGGLGLSLIVASFELLYKSRQDVKQKRLYSKSQSSNPQCFRADFPESENGGYAYNAPCGMQTMKSSSYNSQDANAAHTLV